MSLTPSPMKGMRHDEEGNVAFSEIEHIHDQSDLRFLLGLRSNRKFLSFGEEESMSLSRRDSNSSKSGRKNDSVGRTQKQVKKMLHEQKELRKLLHAQETEALDWEDKLANEQDVLADIEEDFDNTNDDIKDLKADIKSSIRRQEQLKRLLDKKQREFHEKAEAQARVRVDMQKSMGMKSGSGEDVNMTAMGCQRRWWHPSPSPSTAEPLVVYF